MALLKKQGEIILLDINIIKDFKLVEVLNYFLFNTIES